MAGSESTQFRSALHGFNRYDVVNFIESASAEHERALREQQKELSALREQVRSLTAENDTLRAEVDSLRADADALREDAAASQSLLDELTAENASLREQLAAPAEPEPAGEPEPSTSELELAAYRRAEAVERGAIARAGQLYSRMNDVCQSLSSRMQTSEKEVSLLYTELSDCLGRMQEALADVKLVFERAPEQVAALQSEVARDD